MREDYSLDWKMNVRGRKIYEDHIIINGYKHGTFDGDWKYSYKDTIINVIFFGMYFKHKPKFFVPPMLAYYCPEICDEHNHQYTNTPHIRNRLKWKAYTASPYHPLLQIFARNVCREHEVLDRTNLPIPSGVFAYIKN